MPLVRPLPRQPGSWSLARPTAVVKQVGARFHGRALGGNRRPAAPLSQAVKSYALATPGIALLLLVIWLVAPTHWAATRMMAPAFLPITFAAMNAGARLAPLRLANRRKHTVATAPNYATLLLFGPPVAMAVVGGGALAAFFWLVVTRQRRIWDALFNVGQITLAVGVAGIALVWLAPAPPFTVAFGQLNSVVALAVTAVVMYTVNTGAVAGMIAVQQHKNPLAVWLGGRRTDVLPETTLFLVGALAAAAVQQSPWAVIVLAVPTIMVHQTLQWAARLAEQADTAAALETERLKSELLSTVSHELRTPLGTIKGFASGLLEYGDLVDGAARQESLRSIDAAADQLTELVDNLLDLQRLQSGRLTIAHDLVNITEVTQSVVADMAILGKGHPLELVVCPERPLVWGDARRLRQILQNLIDNAIKYSPGGKRVTVRLQCRGAAVELRVEDEGVGIPADQLTRVFDRFHRVDGSLTRRVAGTGLGLAIVRELVTAQGGSVRAESAGGGRGSAFTVTLPIAQPPDGV